MTRPIRVMIADDSPSARLVIRRLLESEPRVEIVAEVNDGVAAVDTAAALSPDVITMDITMPRLDGLGATAAIMAQSPTRVIVVCDTSQSKQTDLSFRAVEAGALELLPKPGTDGAPDIGSWGKRLLETIILMADVPVVRRRPAMTSPHKIETGRRKVSIIGIASSCGGPPVLAQILTTLPKDFGAAVVIAQHLSGGFAAGFCRWLSQLPVQVSIQIAETGLKCRPGCVYIAPDGRDVAVDQHAVLHSQPSRSATSPNADILLSSLAHTHGARAAGVVLTGMGSDGAQGLLALRQAGAFTMAQLPETCVVAGMPQSAARVGATETFLSVDEIARAMIQLASHNGPKW